MNTTTARLSIPGHSAIRPKLNGMPYPTRKVPRSTESDRNVARERIRKEREDPWICTLANLTYIALRQIRMMIAGRFEKNSLSISYIIPSLKSYILPKARMAKRKRKMAETVAMSQVSLGAHSDFLPF